MKTSNLPHAGTDDAIRLAICPEGYTHWSQCCHTEPNDDNTPDFDRNQYKSYTPSIFGRGNCVKFPITGYVEMKARVVGDDGWRGEYIDIILNNGKKTHCVVPDWIDDDAVITLNCRRA